MRKVIVSLLTAMLAVAAVTPVAAATPPGNCQGEVVPSQPGASTDDETSPRPSSATTRRPSKTRSRSQGATAASDPCREPHSPTAAA